MTYNFKDILNVNVTFASRLYYSEYLHFSEVWSRREWKIFSAFFRPRSATNQPALNFAVCVSTWWNLKKAGINISKDYVTPYYPVKLSFV